jgi:hypothetical protein
LTQWEGNVTWHGGVTTSTGGESAPKKAKGDDVSWADVNLTGLKIKKIHVANSACTNGR